MFSNILCVGNFLQVDGGSVVCELSVVSFIIGCVSVVSVEICWC